MASTALTRNHVSVSLPQRSRQSHPRASLGALERQPGNLLVRLVDVVYGEDGEVAVVSEVTQGDAGTGLDLELVDGLLGQVERNRHAEEGAIGKTALLDDTARERPMSAPLQAN